MSLSVGLIAAIATIISKMFVDFLSAASGQSNGSIKIMVMSYITMAVTAFVVGVLLNELVDYYKSWKNTENFV